MDGTNNENQRPTTKEATTTAKKQEEQPPKEVTTKNKEEMTEPAPAPAQPDDYFENNNGGEGEEGSEDKNKPDIDYNEIGGGGETDGDSEVTTFEINLAPSQTKRVNERFEVNCTFIGSSNRKLVWVKLDDEMRSLEIVSSENKEAKTVTSKLIFQSLTRNDNGNYSCYASDKPNKKIELNLNVKSNQLLF